MIVKLGFSPNQYFDDEGMPLAAGRITLTAHGSDIPIRVYSRVGDTYAQAANPIITAADGRIDTVFFDAAVIDVRVEKRLENGQFEPLDTYQYGMDIPTENDATHVIGIDSLKDADTSLGIVYVTGYNNAHDAPERMYIWDEHCVALADDGCVVESNSGESGRWLLVWADEKLPCSVYGITPGVDESNINAFLNYQLVVGTYSIHMPPIPRFLKGTYSTTAALTTGKTLYFDVGAKFNTNINCKSAIVEPGNDYVADFTFTNQDVALAEWFRTARKFLTCGANVLRYGSGDHITDYSITNTVSLTKVTVEGARRLPLNYASGTYIHFNGCNIQGSGIFAPGYDRLKFSNMVWNQEWFNTVAESSYDFGLVAHGARLEYVANDGDDIGIENFPVTEIYLKMRIANEQNSNTPDRKLYLHGRTIKNIITDVFSEVHDAVVTGYLTLTGPTNSLDLYNVTARYEVVLNAAAVTLNNCKLRLGPTASPIDSLVAYDSVIEGNGLTWTRDTAIKVVGGRWSIPMTIADDDTTYPKAVSFEKCVVSFNSDVACKRLSFKDCDITCKNIMVYPYGTGSYTTEFTAVGNIFDINGTIRFDKHATDDDTDNIHDVVPVLVMMDNKFTRQGRGMWMRYWSHVQNKTFYFVQCQNEIALNLLGGKLLYLNNIGYCPQDSFEGEYEQWAEKTVYYPEDGETEYSVRVANSMVYCVPKYFKSSLYFYATDANRKTFWAVSTSASVGNLLTWEGRGSYMRYAQLAQGVLNIGDDVHGDENDALMFANALASYGGFTLVKGFEA